MHPEPRTRHMRCLAIWSRRPSSSSLLLSSLELSDTTINEPWIRALLGITSQVGASPAPQLLASHPSTLAPTHFTPTRSHLAPDPSSLASWSGRRGRSPGYSGDTTPCRMTGIYTAPLESASPLAPSPYTHNLTPTTQALTSNSQHSTCTLTH